MRYAEHYKKCTRPWPSSSSGVINNLSALLTGVDKNQNASAALTENEKTHNASAPLTENDKTHNTSAALTDKESSDANTDNNSSDSLITIYRSRSYSSHESDGLANFRRLKDPNIQKTLYEVQEIIDYEFYGRRYLLWEALQCRGSEHEGIDGHSIPDDFNEGLACIGDTAADCWVFTNSWLRGDGPVTADKRRETWFSTTNWSRRARALGLDTHVRRSNTAIGQISDLQLSTAMEAIIGAVSVVGGSTAVAHVLQKFDLRSGEGLKDDDAVWAAGLLEELEMVGREKGEEGGKSEGEKSGEGEKNEEVEKNDEEKKNGEGEKGEEGKKIEEGEKSDLDEITLKEFLAESREDMGAL